MIYVARFETMNALLGHLTDNSVQERRKNAYRRADASISRTVSALTLSFVPPLASDLNSERCRRAAGSDAADFERSV